MPAYTPAKQRRNTQAPRGARVVQPMVGAPPRVRAAYKRQPGEPRQYDQRVQSIQRDPIAPGVAAGRPLRPAQKYASRKRPSGFGVSRGLR